MIGTWPLVSLGELIRLERRPVEVVADREYKEIGIYSYGRGIFHKMPRSGLEVGDKDLFLMKEGDLILQITFAWEGAIVLCSKAEDGLFGSVRYPTFRVNEERCFAPFLVKYLCTRQGLEQIGRICPGSAGRNRVLAIKRLAEVVIPLPPLDEQRRVAARIEELAAKVSEGQSLRHNASDEADAIILSALNRHFVERAIDWSPLPMQEAIEISDKQVDPKLPEYARLPHISGENIESGTCQLLPWRTAEADGVKSNNYLFSPGSILYSKIRPYLRKAAFVDFKGVSSAEVYPIRVLSAKINPQFLKWTLVAEPFTNYANRLSGRTRMPKLNRKQLFGFRLTHPPLPKQHQIAGELEAIQAEMSKLKRLQDETSAELDALMSSILDKAFKGDL